MRTLIELLIAAAIVALAWEKPLKETLPWITSPPPQAAATATPPGAWVHDPNQQTRLDKPTDPSVAKDNSSLRDPHHQTPLDPPKKSATPH